MLVGVGVAVVDDWDAESGVGASAAVRRNGVPGAVAITPSSLVRDDTAASKATAVAEMGGRFDANVAILGDEGRIDK
jgi:hypothetical protein